MDFLRDNTLFSFKLGGKNIWDTDYKVTRTQKDNLLVTEYYFGEGLKVTNEARFFPEFDGYEWVNTIENLSDKPTEIISELYDCSVSLPMNAEKPKTPSAMYPSKNDVTRLYSPSGSNWSKTEFYCDVDDIVENSHPHYLYSDEQRHFTASNGRSSDGKNAPFFNIHKDGKGYIWAIGWTGQWQCHVHRLETSVSVKTGIEDCHFKVLPGEAFRTSSVVIMKYEGDFNCSQNKWRRFVKKHFSLIGTEQRPKYGPFCAMIWGGMKTESILQRIEIIKKNKLPFDHIWMDAGWYGADTKATPNEFEGDWGAHTGDWVVSPYIHPNGLQDVSEELHKAGLKLVMWFEPERVVKTTPIASEHPEYFLKSPDDNSPNLLLNLGDEKAWEYCCNFLGDFIEKLKIDCYRQDFNMPALEYWRNNDAPDRKGITEIKHICGLYRLWDKLLERFPTLIIDNCSSGGRRIDIETLRRSMPLWRSDYQCPANYNSEGAQCHHMSYNTWMPYSGTGTGREYSEYRIRSAYDYSMTACHSFSETDAYCDTEEKALLLKKYAEEYLKLRRYFAEDYYPLTQLSERSDAWCATQFDCPEGNDGIVQVFKREESPYETAVFHLFAVKKDKEYLFSDLDGGEFTVTGEELIKNGFRVTIHEKKKAKVYMYRCI